MADETDKKPAQKLVQMPQAVHQLVTGKGEKDVIEPGTLITDDVAKTHKLNDDAVKQLTKTGAIHLVDVLTA